MLRRSPFLCLAIFVGSLVALTARAAPVEFNLPAQAAADALLTFSEQARVEVLFSSDDLRAVTTGAVVGRYEPEDALNRLLKDTGFLARRKFAGKFVIVSARPAGTIRGQLLTADGQPAAGVTVAISGTRLSTRSDAQGEFTLAGVPPGRHELFVRGEGYQPMQLQDVEIEAGQLSWLPAQRLQPAREFEHL